MVTNNTEPLYERARAVIQEWADKQSHDRCWYYPELFNQLIGIFEIQPTKKPMLSSIDEFQKGCERFIQEEYNESPKR